MVLNYGLIVSITEAEFILAAQADPVEAGLVISNSASASSASESTRFLHVLPFLFSIFS